MVMIITIMVITRVNKINLTMFAGSFRGIHNNKSG